MTLLWCFQKFSNAVKTGHTHHHDIRSRLQTKERNTMPSIKEKALGQVAGNCLAECLLVQYANEFPGLGLVEGSNRFSEPLLGRSFNEAPVQVAFGNEAL